MISKKLIEELRVIIRDDYGREVSREEALEIGAGLVQYFDLLAKVKHEQEQNGSDHSAGGLE